MLISCVSAWSAYVCRVDGGRVLKLLLSSFSSTHTAKELRSVHKVLTSQVSKDHLAL